jgi:hypothetical protein
MAQPAREITTLTLELSREASEKLARRAAASGQKLPEFISELVEHFSGPPTPLEELSGPIYQRFLDSGTTDEELSEELERAKHEMRADRRARNAS